MEVFPKLACLDFEKKSVDFVEFSASVMLGRCRAINKCLGLLTTCLVRKKPVIDSVCGFTIISFVKRYRGTFCSLLTSRSRQFSCLAFLYPTTSDTLSRLAAGSKLSNNSALHTKFHISERPLIAGQAYVEKAKAVRIIVPQGGFLSKQ